MSTKRNKADTCLHGSLRRLTAVLLAMVLMCISGVRDTRADSAAVSEPIPVIIDTDIGNSTDDLFALELAYRLMDQGYLDLKGIVVDRMGDGYADLIDIMNTYYGHPDIPIGVERNGLEGTGIYIDYRLLDDMTREDGSRMFARTDEDMSDNEDGYILYRRLLSEAKDHSVRIVSIGFVTSLVQLLESEPDDISSLSGAELVSQKVHSIYLMGTKLGENDLLGYNLKSDISLAQRLFSEWPSNVDFYLSTSPVGDLIDYPRELVLADLSYNLYNPIAQTYLNKEITEGQRMWDVLCVLNAAFPQFFPLSPRGTVEVSDEGSVIFTKDLLGNVYYQIDWGESWADQILVVIRFYTLMH